MTCGIHYDLPDPLRLGRWACPRRCPTRTTPAAESWTRQFVKGNERGQAHLPDLEVWGVVTEVVRVELVEVELKFS